MHDASRREESGRAAAPSQRKLLPIRDRKEDIMNRLALRQLLPMILMFVLAIAVVDSETRAIDREDRLEQEL